ncbi:MAG: hypothetical protein GWN84_26070 [Gammaproteobacteria bacterium]|nr:hypothetical protein [Gammaproteobacteria bacterium]NIR82549.1 hypothetical protein [Gammaproteobacteria bacterium]NIU04054.1 hypothetical protein [Gammaproteobacteria bacterium]NIX85328.1 hypothetical protein [Gammaproteobacteria bacterium]
MVKALAAGVPVFSLGPSMATRMGSSDLSRIEQPLYPENREQWFAALAANQWTMAEIEAGTAWRDLKRQASVSYDEPAGQARVSAIADPADQQDARNDELFDGPTPRFEEDRW